MSDESISARIERLVAEEHGLRAKEERDSDDDAALAADKTRLDEVAVELDAVAHVYALMPLTEEIVTALNPEVLLKNLKDDIAEIGYPRP